MSDAITEHYARNAVDCRLAAARTTQNWYREYCLEAARRYEELARDDSELSR